ncbi:hypothetical protein HYDPIDRAFT_118370 [Hydnomerulius pinastri MD-312]|uniref:Uncharacterized protein n=1 Tax=Hydnomerulius pinastri MD-312 TaxID=994086 RepID=A0A0C9V2V9_9AGAM|nr:hypothetical protein HYDPIDRAFT_118370 [Hydnomerulius pinastri MD-312]
MAAVFSQDQDNEPLAFLAAAQGELEQEDIEASKPNCRTEKRLFNRLKGTLGRIKKAAESRPLKDKGNGKAREDATPAPDTATAEDTAQNTPPREALDRFKNRLKKHAMSRKGRKREASESESPRSSKQDANDRAALQREHTRERGERLRQRLTGRREGQSTDHLPGEHSSSAADPEAPIRHYTVAYGFMEPRVVAAPMPDSDDEEEKSWGQQLFEMICYCPWVPQYSPPPRRRTETYDPSSDESDSD